MRTSLPKPSDDDSPLNAALEHEILAEKAATYARLVKGLEDALAELRAFGSEAADGAFDSAHGHSARKARGPARARPDGRASMACRASRGSGTARHSLTDRSGNRPEGGKAKRPPAGQAAPAEAVSASERAVSEKEQLLRKAGRALWYVMIQRDLCGFRQNELFYKELKVPREVRARMGLTGSR